MRSRLIPFAGLFGVLLLAACDADTNPFSPDGAELLGAAAAVSAASDLYTAPGAVFTSSNRTAGNEVLAFARSADGTLTAADIWATGGTGTGGGLGNQGAVTLTPDGRRLLVVNAGSDDVSVFRVGADLDLLSTTDSRGTRPISARADRTVPSGSIGSAPWSEDDRRRAACTVLPSPRRHGTRSAPAFPRPTRRR